MRAPHQASDKRFYKRYNFISEMMEEYEIRDVAHRAVAPDLQLQFKFDSGLQVSLRFLDTKEWSNPIDLLAVVTNNSATPAECAVISVYIDSSLSVRGLHGNKHSTQVTRSLEGRDISCHHFSFGWGRDKLPIFEEVYLAIDGTPFQLEFKRQPGRYLLGWDLHSPRMPLKQGYCLLEFDGVTVKLVEP
jgi:hypothetical protein